MSGGMIVAFHLLRRPLSQEPGYNPDLPFTPKQQQEQQEQQEQQRQHQHPLRSLDSASLVSVGEEEAEGKEDWAAAPPFDPQETLFFLHIPLTGGTAVSWHLAATVNAPTFLKKSEIRRKDEIEGGGDLKGRGEGEAGRRDERSNVRMPFHEDGSGASRRSSNDGSMSKSAVGEGRRGGVAPGSAYRCPFHDRCLVGCLCFVSSI
jgi:hypothetical protein